MAIRIIGAALLIMCGFAMTALTTRSGVPADSRAIGLAAIAFIAGSTGTAALMTGRGLFERITVASRWQCRRGR